MQKIRSNKRKDDFSRDTNTLLDELSDMEGSFSLSGIKSPSGASSSLSTPGSSRSSTPSSRKHLSSHQHPAAKKKSNVDNTFKLPAFSPAVRQCISKDSFYTSTQRNRLIREACLALRGHCWQEEKVVTNTQKKALAKMLLDLSPKSLGKESW